MNDEVRRRTILAVSRWLARMPMDQLGAMLVHANETFAEQILFAMSKEYDKDRSDRWLTFGELRERLG